MNPLSFFNSIKISRKRVGVSPVIATTIILAITITLGLGLWSFAASGVSTATQNYANVVTEYGRYTSDRFVIANVAFDYPDNGQVSFWIYNSGKTVTTITGVVVVCRDCPPNSVPSVSLVPADVLSKELQIFSFDLSPDKITGDPQLGGKTFELTVVSETGATQTFLKRSD